MVMFSLDGINYDVKCTILRTAELTASEISGMLLDRSYFNDVIGTFLKYDLALSVPLKDLDKYSDLYEALTDPVDGHSFVLPYNGGRLSITGRITTVSDEFMRMPGGRTYWRNTKFSVIANHPSKSMSLGQIIARGRSPLPEVSAVQLGDIYLYTSTGWVKQDWPDADVLYY